MQRKFRRNQKIRSGNLAEQIVGIYLKTIELLKAQAGKPVDLVISDLGSGLNYKKTGFKRLLLLILQGKVRELILTHKDRWLRFGSEIIFKSVSTWASR